MTEPHPRREDRQGCPGHSERVGRDVSAHRPGVLHMVDRPADYLAAAATARSVASTAESPPATTPTPAGPAALGRSRPPWFDAAGHDDPSVEAFRVAPTPSQRFDSIVTSWSAPTALPVTDRAFGGIPRRSRRATCSCARHQEDISAYRQQTGWDD